MNPLLQQALGSILRFALIGLASYLVKHGIWTNSAAEGYVEAAVAALLAVGWSLWQKYSSRSKLLTALMLPPGSTENDLRAHLASGAATPAINTPPNTPPGVPALPAADHPFNGPPPPPYDSTAVNPIKPNQ